MSNVPEKNEQSEIKGKGVATLSSVFRHLISLFIILWAGVLTYYFIYNNRQLLYTFISLFKEYNWNFSNFDYVSFIIAAAGTAIMTFTGRSYMRGLNIYLPAKPEMAIAFVIGMGVIGVSMTLLTMAHLLYQIPTIIVLLMVIGYGIHLDRKCTKRCFPVPFDSTNEYMLRMSQIKFYREEFNKSIIEENSFADRLFYSLAMTFTVIITALTLIHALCFPVTYWDSLILYTGYARMMFLEHAFPFKATAQVGIGLGSNYPHLYPMITATIATTVNKWNELFAQLNPPVAMLLTTILIYYIVLHITRRRSLAVSAALMFRALPYGIAYSQYASDYAFSILFTAALLYLILELIETQKQEYFILAAAVCAFATHINFLMWVLWGALILAGVLAYFKYPNIKRRNPDEYVNLSDELIADDPFEESPIKREKNLDFAYNTNPPGVLKFFTGKVFILTFIIAFSVASIWYVRNQVLTGNPVYAFFPDIFGGININKEVLKSAEAEWLANGDGIGRAASDVLQIPYDKLTLKDKLSVSFGYFVLYHNTSWKLAPSFMGLCIPGVLIFFFAMLTGFFRKDYIPELKKKCYIFDNTTKFYLVVASLFFVFLFYEYCIAGLYLYQIIAFIVPAVLFGAFALDFANKTPWKHFIRLIILVAAITPGITMGLMGFKFNGIANIGGQQYSQLDLVAFRNLFMDKEMFLGLVYPQDMKMVTYINKNLKDINLLTHENRHLLYDPSIKIIHLDDWEIQSTYNMKSNDEKEEVFKKMGITHYLYIPNEDAHIVNKKVGLSSFRKEADGNRIVRFDWEENSRMELVFQSGENRLYKFRFADEILKQKKEAQKAKNKKEKSGEKEEDKKN